MCGGSRPAGGEPNHVSVVEVRAVSAGDAGQPVSASGHRLPVARASGAMAALRLCARGRSAPVGPHARGGGGARARWPGRAVGRGRRRGSSAGDVGHAGRAHGGAAWRRCSRAAPVGLDGARVGRWELADGAVEPVGACGLALVSTPTPTGRRGGREAGCPVRPKPGESPAGAAPGCWRALAPARRRVRSWPPTAGLAEQLAPPRSACQLAVGDQRAVGGADDRAGPTPRAQVSRPAGPAAIAAAGGVVDQPQQRPTVEAAHRRVAPRSRRAARAGRTRGAASVGRAGGDDDRAVGWDRCGQRPPPAASPATGAAGWHRAKPQQFAATVGCPWGCHIGGSAAASSRWTDDPV